MERLKQIVHDSSERSYPGSLTSADDWLTYDELAAIIKISRRTLERYVALEKIPHHRIENYFVRFNRAEVEAWLLKRRRLKL